MSTTTDSTTSGHGDAAAYEVIIKLSSGVTFPLSVTPPSSVSASQQQPLLLVAHVKQCIHDKHPETPVESQKLIYKGRILEDAKSLGDYGIVPQSTLFLVVSSASQTPRMTAQTEQPPATTDSSSTTTRGPPPPPDSLASLMENMFGGDDGDDDHGSNNSRNNSRRTSTNPQLQQILNDPGALQQAMEMMRNPGALQQAMRQQDLAMSQLENMPGGFNALRSMYNSMDSLEDDLMMPPTSSSRNNGSDNAADSGTDDNAGATGAAMPNPWESSSSSNLRRSQPTNPLSHSNRSRGNGAIHGMPGQTTPASGSSAAGANSMFPAGASRMARPGASAMANSMMEQLIQGNPDMIREVLTQQDPMLAGLFSTMSNEQANEFIRHVLENPPPADFESLMHGGQGGSGNMEEMMERMMRNPPSGGAPNPWLSPAPSPGSSLAGRAAPPAPRLNPWSGSAGSSTNAGSNSSSSTAPLSLDFASLLGTRPSPVQPIQGSADPQVRFQRQLQSLRSMGFDQDERSILALSTAGGNVNRAVDWLLSHPEASVPLSSALSTATATTATTMSPADAGADASGATDAAPGDEDENKE